MVVLGKDGEIAVDHDSDGEVEDMPEWMKEAAKAEAGQIDQLYDAMDAERSALDILHGVLFYHCTRHCTRSAARAHFFKMSLSTYDIDDSCSLSIDDVTDTFQCMTSQRQCARSRARAIFSMCRLNVSHRRIDDVTDSQTRRFKPYFFFLYLRYDVRAAVFFFLMWQRRFRRMASPHR